MAAVHGGKDPRLFVRDTGFNNPVLRRATRAGYGAANDRRRWSNDEIVGAASRQSREIAAINTTRRHRNCAIAAAVEPRRSRPRPDLNRLPP